MANHVTTILSLAFLLLGWFQLDNGNLGEGVYWAIGAVISKLHWIGSKLI